MSDPHLTNEQNGSRADWSDYRIFGAVVKHGGFNAAARALGMNQAGLSRKVRDLEIRLNVKLLERRHDGVVLTEAGELIFDHVVTMEHSAASIEKLVADRDRRAEGRVVISVPDGIGGFLVAPKMADFLTENPAIRLVLDCGLAPETPGGRPEVFLTFERPTSPEMVAEPVAHVHWCLFAAQSYIDLYGMPSTLPEAAAHRAVDLSAYAPVERESWTAKVDAFMKLRSVSVETDSSAVAFLAVAHGAGVAPLPTYVLALDSNLVLIDTAHAVTAPLWLVHHRELAHSARIRKVAEWLKSIFDAKDQPWFRKEFVHPSEFAELARQQAQLFRGETVPAPVIEARPRPRAVSSTGG